MSPAAVRVRLLPSGIELTAGGGERVLDAIDEQRDAGLPLACRAGNCGACLVGVGAGGALLAPPEHAERETLVQLGARSEQRLGCQLALRPGASGLLVLELQPAR